MFDFITISLLLLLLILLGVLIYLFSRNARSSKTEDNLLIFSEKLTELSRQNDQLRQELDRKLNESHRVSQESVDRSSKLISNITEKLTKLDETNKQVISFSEQLSNLEKVLTNQKKRGNLGEAGLKLVLENILPPDSYELQHRFKDGDTVDAIIKTKEGMIPVDAKFSLDNYQKILNENDLDRKIVLEKEFANDLKKRINETSKYIKTKEGTLDFALMFVPAEAIYYDLLVNKVGSSEASLIDYAYREKRVIVVSPTTFAAYLQTILQGLRALQIEEGAKNIRKNVENLARHLSTYDDFMRRLGSSMSSSANHYNNAYKEFKKIDKDVARISDKESKLEIIEIEGPEA